MKRFPVAVMAGSIGFLTACGGGSDSDGGDLTELAVNLSGSVALPEQMALVTPADDANRQAMRALPRAIKDTSTFASSSDYHATRQNVYVWLDAVEPISFIDDFLCFTGQSQPLAMNGEGNYVAWANAGRCFDEKDGSDQQQGSSGTAPTQYVTMVANASQADAESPLELSAWIEDYSGQSGEEHGPDAIKMKGQVTQTPSDANPYGVFTLTYGLLPTLSSSESEATGYGEVSSSATTDGGASFTLYQYDERQEDSGMVECTTTASVDYNETTETGVARTGRQCVMSSTGQATPWGNGAYALAVNSDYVHMAMANSYAGLSSPDSEMCLMRNEFNEVAWNYALFNAADGSKVNLNSGMQLKIDADGDGSGSDGNGFESWGHIGYWGSWREDGQTFDDGETVQQATYDGSTGNQFTVRKAPGRLVKNSIESVSLADLQGVQFNLWMNENDTYLLSTATDFNGDSDTTDGLELVVEVNDTNNGFEVVGIQNGWGDNGPEITEVNPAVAIATNADRSLHLWSNQLGGGVNFNTSHTKVRVFARSYVNGTETGTGELFESSSSADLVCLERCLKADVSATDIGSSADWAAVFEGGSSQTSVNYDFAQSNLTLVNDGGANAIGLASAVTTDNLESSMHWQWGLETGPMVPAGTATDASDFYTKVENGTITTFYHWETGLQPWQQQIVLLDGSNQPVNFDKPIAFKYVHEQTNDRNGSTDNIGAVFMLEYGGHGQLHGLPWMGDENGWYPMVSLADGTLLGASNQYVIKAVDVEQKMQSTSLSNCSNLPLTAPSQSIPTGIEQAVFSLGAMPDVSDLPPAVIDGEIVE